MPTLSLKSWSKGSSDRCLPCLWSLGAKGLVIDAYLVFEVLQQRVWWSMPTLSVKSCSKGSSDRCLPCLWNLAAKGLVINAYLVFEVLQHRVYWSMSTLSLKSCSKGSSDQRLPCLWSLGAKGLVINANLVFEVLERRVKWSMPTLSLKSCNSWFVYVPFTWSSLCVLMFLAPGPELAGADTVGWIEKRVSMFCDHLASLTWFIVLSHSVFLTMCWQ